MHCQIGKTIFYKTTLLCTCAICLKRFVCHDFIVSFSVAPEIRAIPEEGLLVVKEGEPANLACEILKGSPTPEITWKRKVRRKYENK
jgi:hypothetical protein